MPVLPDISFPAIYPRGHRPRFGQAVRVPLPTSMVDPATLEEISRLTHASGRSRGLVIDRLTSFAVARGFNASYLSKKEAAPASTPRAAKTNRASRQHVPKPTTVNRKATSTYVSK